MFQSHNDAIAASDIELLHGADFNVSIPQWCDCCRKVDATLETAQACFNPTMVRLLPRFVGEVGKYIRGFNPTMVRLLPDRSGFIYGG